MLGIIASSLVLTALSAYLNLRFVGLPTTNRVMAAALLSLPAGPQRETLVALTCCVVVFSILGAGAVDRQAGAPRGARLTRRLRRVRCSPGGATPAAQPGGAPGCTAAARSGAQPLPGLIRYFSPVARRA